VVCMDAPKDRIVLPCMHLCACEACAQRLLEMDASCPVCRGPVERIAQVFSQGVGWHNCESAWRVDIRTYTCSLCGVGSGLAASHRFWMWDAALSGCVISACILC
jgi:hypothetical protein